MISKKNNQFPYFKNIFPYLMETIEELIIIVSMDNSYKIEYVHKSEYSKQLGYLEDTLQGKSLFDLINFGELNSKTDILGNLLNNGNNIEVNIINKNGNLTWALLKSSIINDAQNQQKLLLILRDISRIKDLENKLREAEKKKDVERKLEESEEKFRTIAEQSLMGICIIQDFMIKYSNQQISKIYGYTFEEISQWEPKELLKVIHPDSREMVETYLKRNQQESEKIAIHYIIKIIKKNGNIRYIENYSKPIRFQGKMADLITQVDITARINAEHKIDSSEEKYQRILENMMDGYYETDLSGKLLYANAAFCKILGYSKEEMIGKDNRSYFDNKSSVILFDIFSQVYKTGIPHPPSGFIKVMTLKKKLIYVEGSIDLLYDSEGKKVGFYGIVRDITERKIAEQKLRESEVKYRHLYENSPNSIILFNLKGEMLDCNLITESLSGFKREELIGKKYRKASFFHKDYLPILLEEFKSLLKKKMIEPIEIQLYTKKGSLIWANVQASLFDYQNEKIIQVIIQPIDDIKKAEEKFRNIAEQSLMGIFILQNGFFKYFNDKIDDITGYTREEMKNWVPYEFLKLVHPEDKEFVSEQARKKQAGDPDAIDQYNFRLIRKDNEIRWIEILSKSIDYKGSPADLAMIYDITDKIDTQKKLKESEEKFSKAFNAHSSAMLITSLEDGKVIELNDAFSIYFCIKR
ncbi:MAG: PAS domain S-box protein [Candidatus Odinarchaeota archaeon]